MSNQFPPTAGEWYQGLPSWKKGLFNFLARTVGDMRAMEWCGYHKYKQQRG
ncbi:MAG: hypothetical protein K2Y22_14090 [Candidatus Obscuribacterales bacterium]|nr:hypothetical protein [Candidatus Obscuribacterales bacterium]